MNELRKKFEEIHSINLMLTKPIPIYFNDENNMYMGGTDEDYYWVNGAWMAFQEQYRKIDAVKKECEEWYRLSGNALAIKIQELLK